MSTNQLALGASWPRSRAAGKPAGGWAKRFANSILGHFWTIAPALRAALRQPAAPPSSPFSVTFDDPTVGAIRLTGALTEVANTDTLVLIVHGLSGSAESSYCIKAARAAQAAGLSSLRLSLRGADGSGDDISHGGLTDDLKAALASPLLTRYNRILLLGYSVGGHVALRAAIEAIDSRVRAVAAICPPLDLFAATTSLDRPAARLYRTHVIAGLNATYRRIVSRRFAFVPAATVRGARSSRERDALTVVHRFGFRNVGDYYAQTSVATDIHRLQLPSMLVASTHDPIVPPETLRPTLRRAPSALQVRWIDGGGHVFFPPTLDLGEGGALGLESQVMQWLSRQ